jgi:hypothetical protein
MRPTSSPSVIAATVSCTAKTSDRCGTQRLFRNEAIRASKYLRLRSIIVHRTTRPDHLAISRKCQIDKGSPAKERA